MRRRSDKEEKEEGEEEKEKNKEDEKQETEKEEEKEKKEEEANAGSESARQKHITSLVQTLRRRETSLSFTGIQSVLCLNANQICQLFGC